MDELLYNRSSSQKREGTFLKIGPVRSSSRNRSKSGSGLDDGDLGHGTRIAQIVLDGFKSVIVVFACRPDTEIDTTETPMLVLRPPLPSPERIARPVVGISVAEYTGKRSRTYAFYNTRQHD